MTFYPPGSITSLSRTNTHYTSLTLAPPHTPLPTTRTYLRQMMCQCWACLLLNLFLPIPLICLFCRGEKKNEGEPSQLHSPFLRKLNSANEEHSLEIRCEGRRRRRDQSISLSLSLYQGLVLQQQGQLLCGSSSYSICPLWFHLSLGDFVIKRTLPLSLQPKDGSSFLLLLISGLPPLPSVVSVDFLPLV